MKIQTLFSRAPVTILLIASFVGLFIIQVLTGVNPSEPSGESLVKWGANYLPLTISTEPWRMITSAFLHIGFMHLLFNAFAIYFLGQVAEMVFGSVKLLLLFLLSAIGGNLLNLYDGVYWQVLSSGSILSAGASGGVMGIGMSLLVLELMRHTLLKPRNSANGQLQYRSDTSLLKNLAVLMAINLVYGFAVSGIDNAGHIGGALTGGVLAVSYVLANPNFNRRIATTARLQSSQVTTPYSNQSMLLGLLPWITSLAIAVMFMVLWLSLHHKLVMP